MFVKCLSFVLLFGLVWGQSELSLPENITLPPVLQGKVDPDQVRGLQNQSEPVLRKKCEENGGPTAFDSAKAASGEFQACLQGLVNVSQLNEEIEKASPTGQVDEVFQRYCEKTPMFKQCFSKMVDSMKPCFSPKERENIKIVHNVTEKLSEFICNKEGDRIALFISEGGKECFEQQSELLQDCANKTLGLSATSEDPSNWTPDSIPKIAFGMEECKKLSELQVCVVDVLEKCPKPTTGNIVESLFKFIRKATPCNDKVESKKGSAAGLAVTSVTILFGVLTSLLI